MSGIWGTVLVSAVLAIAAALAVRSIWKGRKTGGCCGDCIRCRGCH